MYCNLSKLQYFFLELLVHLCNIRNLPEATLVILNLKRKDNYHMGK